MTLASDIISDAYRETNLIPLGVSPTANQTTEALTRLNAIFSSLLGNEVGDPLCDLNISSGQYDQSDWCLPYISYDTRLVLDLTEAKSLFLDPLPTEGQRLSFVDVGNNLATYNVTLNGNGRLIEGAATATLNTNGDSRQWLYRADTGNWVKITTLNSDDTMPLPAEFDDFFVTSLAMRLNPRYGQSLAQETIVTLKNTRARLRARYNQPRQVRPDVQIRNGLNDWDGYNGFDVGRGYWPWK